MKWNFSFVFLFLFYSKLFSQETQNIRFKYFGIEIRPTTVFSISKWKPAKSTDINAESILRKSIFTDLNNFEFIKEFVNSKHYLVKSSKHLSDGFHRLASTFQSDRYLPGKYICIVCNWLSDGLKKKNLDMNVIDTVENY